MLRRGAQKSPVAERRLPQMPPRPRDLPKRSQRREARREGTSAASRFGNGRPWSEWMNWKSACERRRLAASDRQSCAGTVPLGPSCSLASDGVWAAEGQLLCRRKEVVPL